LTRSTRRRRHLSRWEKIAAVTGIGWTASGVNLSGFAIPCPVKVSAGKELASAEAWIVRGAAAPAEPIAAGTRIGTLW
jgi:hypothetical protein